MLMSFCFQDNGYECGDNMECKWADTEEMYECVCLSGFAEVVNSTTGAVSHCQALDLNDNRNSLQFGGK